MSLYDYRESQGIHGSFYALIMAAMRKADTNNLRLLKAAFPEVWDELSKRYNARGGMIEGD
jgi:hypothetical protein